MWPVAQPENRRFKIFLFGPPGCFKTRVMLRLMDNGDRNKPTAAVVDTEFGTKHYAKEFAFRRLESNDCDEIMQKVKGLVKNPGEIVTLGIDSFSVYYDAVIDKYVDLFLKRELSSKGNKTDYYTLQPRDYVHINREANNLVRLLLKSDLNIIVTCQVKDKWGDDMKIVGSVFDGWKRLPYYFDTIIEMQEDKSKPGKWKAIVKGKDRSNSLPPNSEIPWEDDAKIVKFLEKKFGQRLATDKQADGYDPDAPEKPAAAPAATTTQPAAPAPATPPAQTAQAPSAEPAKADPPAQDKAPKPTEAAPAAAEAKPATDADQKDPKLQGPITHDQLVEIVTLKKACKINDPAAWAKLVAAYTKPDGTPHTSAKEFTEEQGGEFIKDLIRIQEDPTLLSSSTAGKPSTR